METTNIRKEILLRRDRLSELERQQWSDTIVQRCLSLGQLTQAKTLLIYMDFRSEVITRNFIETLLEMGKQVVLPVTMTKQRKLHPVFVTNIDKDLSPRYASILEPIADIWETRFAPPETIDIIFLPGSVFDERGGRMGYGGGYYDRFVSQKAPQALRIGLAYDMQVVKEAPLQPHDELLDLIITEKRLIPGSRKKDE